MKRLFPVAGLRLPIVCREIAPRVMRCGLTVVLMVLSGGASALYQPLRIMAIGDSITAGYTDNPDYTVPFEFGYRSGLYTRLSDAGYDFQFVGSSQEPWNEAYGDPTQGGTVSPTLDLRTLGQDHHNGYGGLRISGVQNNAAAWLAADEPDVILLMIGINGINTVDPATLDTAVNTILTHAPSAHLVIAQITPFASFNQNLLDYNTRIRETLVPGLIAQGKPVSTIDLYSLFLTDPNDPTSIGSGMHANNINHPTNAMYAEMAQVWFDEIERLYDPPAQQALIYHAATGGLSIDTQGEPLINYVLQASGFIEENHSKVLGGVGSSFDFNLSESTLAGTTGLLELGQVLPAGMTPEALEAFFSERVYVSQLAAPIRTFQLVYQPIPGDNDSDGDIDDSDLGTALANYTGPVGAAGNKTTLTGDTDGDGDVDDSDLGTAFSGYTGPLAPSNVPEPASLLVLGLSGGLFINRRPRQASSHKIDPRSVRPDLPWALLSCADAR